MDGNILRGEQKPLQLRRGRRERGKILQLCIAHIIIATHIQLLLHADILPTYHHVRSSV